MARNSSLYCPISKKLELIYLDTFNSNHLEKLNKRRGYQSDSSNCGCLIQACSSPILMTSKKGKYGDYAYWEKLNGLTSLPTSNVAPCTGQTYPESGLPSPSRSQQTKHVMRLEGKTDASHFVDGETTYCASGDASSKRFLTQQFCFSLGSHQSRQVFPCTPVENQPRS